MEPSKTLGNYQNIPSETDHRDALVIGHSQCSRRRIRRMFRTLVRQAKLCLLSQNSLAGFLNIPEIKGTGIAATSKRLSVFLLKGQRSEGAQPPRETQMTTPTWTRG